jgi:hypothetical protein
LDAGFSYYQASEECAAMEGFQGGVANQLGVVVVFADVAQDQRGDAGIEIILNKSGGDFIRQVAAAAHDALLHRPRVGADAQHFQIVIRFEDDQIARAHVDAQGIGDIAKIGGYGDFDAVRRERVADRIGGIMGNRETGDIEIADGEASPGLKSFKRRLRVAP